MKICLIYMGKTEFGYLTDGIDVFIKRLKHYIPVEVSVIPDLKKTKGLPVSERKRLEGEVILKQVKNDDVLVLLDENGDQYTSTGFAGFLQTQMNSGAKRLVFVVGGAFGFSPDVYQRARYTLSLSKMTFSHQMVRLFFVEQLYRAFTIIKGEPYHNE